MALHLAANGCYGVMIYNNKDYSDSVINDELKKYGKVHELQRGGKNLIFIYYKQYEEARACLDALSNQPDFNAKPARPRETSRSNVPGGARERAKSVIERGEKGRQRIEQYDKKKSNDRVEDDPVPLRTRSMSLTSISLDKVECPVTQEESKTPEKGETKRESTEEPKLSDKKEEGIEAKEKVPFRPRSKSVGRLNIEDEAKRAEIIKKVIKCESDRSGSLDSLFEKELNSVDDDSDLNKKSEDASPLPRLHRAKSFHGSLATHNSDDNDKKCFRGKKNLWLSPKENLYFGKNDRYLTKSVYNEPFLLPAMTIYEHYFIASQKKKYSHIVVISGLPLYITEEYLCDLCTKFARVLRIRMAETPRIEEGRAYVYVKSRKDAMNLKKNVDQKILFCHIVKVTILSDIKNVCPFIKY